MMNVTALDTPTGARVVDLSTSSVRELNAALHASMPDTNATRWQVLNPRGRHALAAGIDARSPSRSTAMPAITAPA
jgi:hypothetical protein